MSNRWTRKKKAIAAATAVCTFSLAGKQAMAAVIVSTLVAYSSGGAICNTETAWLTSDGNLLNKTLSSGQEVLYGGTTDKYISTGQSGYSQELTHDSRDTISHHVQSQVQSNGNAIHEDSAFSQADGTPMNQTFCDAGQLALMEQGGDAVYTPSYAEDVSSREITITDDLQFSGSKIITQIDETPDSVQHQYEQTGNGTYTDFVRTRSRIGTDSNQTDMILDQTHMQHNVLNGTFDMKKDFSFSSFKTAFRENTSTEEP